MSPNILGKKSVHLAHPRQAGVAFCHPRNRAPEASLTADRKLVTCFNCIKKYGRGNHPDFQEENP